MNHTEPTSEVCLVRPKKSIIMPNIYEGIPQNLLINVIVWLLLVLLFSFIRKKVWNHGRLGLLNRRQGPNRKWMEVFYGRQESKNPQAETPESPRARNRREDSRYSIFLPKDDGFFGWIKVTCTLTDEQFRKTSGPDAVHYLSFQRHLMVVMCITTVVAIGIALPVNYHGNLVEDRHSFARTTVTNLASDSPSLWVHIFFSIVFIPIVDFVMRRASGRRATKCSTTNTLMVDNIERSRSNVAAIKSTFYRYFPTSPIRDIELAYNVEKLTEVVGEYSCILDAKGICQQNGSFEMKAGSCSCKKIDALEYYTRKEERLRHQVIELRAESLTRPLGIAFINMQTVEAARFVISEYRMGNFRGWQVKFAPSPPDIFWENLTSDYNQWYCRWLVVNISLFFVLFFLTTPIYIVNLLGEINNALNAPKFNPTISESLSTLMLLLFSITMPVIVAYSEKLLNHTTRSELNHTVMTKAFGYLLFMVIILPSLGLSSAQAFLKWIIDFNIDETEVFRWECVFLPGRGAFYVNYIMTAAFIGTAFELIRIPDILEYMWLVFRAKSQAEIPYIRKNLLNEFPYGVHYAWTILIFTTTTVYSLACPLITPFAMVYILMKHLVDRHNLYFAYDYSDMVGKGGGRIHVTAVTMTKVSVLLKLVVMAALTSVRSQIIDARGLTLIIALNVSIVMFMVTSFIKRWSCASTSDPEPKPQYLRYVAPVLQ